MSEPCVPRVTHRPSADSRTEPDPDLIALAAVPESDARLQLALDASGIGTFHWQIGDARAEPDRRMLALLGLSPDRTCSLTEILQRLVHRDDRRRCVDAFARAIDPAGAGTLRDEFRVRHADGSVRWLAFVAQTTFEAAPSPDVTSRRAVQMSGAASDITERKRREANLVLLDHIADDCARLSSPEEIMQVVGARLGAHLRVSSACLVAVDETRDEIGILHMWNRTGSPIRPDVVRISDFVSADYRRAARAGDPLIVHDTESDPRTHAKAHTRLQIRSFMSVPFVRDGGWKFLLTVCDSRPHDWRDDEVGLFRQLADRLFARLEHALAEQAVANDLRDTQRLRDLSVRLVFESDTQAFFDAIVGAAISIASATAGCLQLLDADANELVLLAYHGFDPQAAPRFSRVSAASPTSCGRALESGRPAVVHFDDPNLVDSDGMLRLFVDAGFRSAQSMPLVTRAGRMVGMLSTHWSESGRTLSERELRFLDLLTRQAAELIERRRIDDALRESEQRLSAELADTQLLQTLSAQLIEGSGGASLYETLVDAAKSIMHSDYASMQILCPDLSQLRLIASRGFDDEAKARWEWVAATASTTCAQALRLGARVVVPDVVECAFMAGTIDQARLLESGIHASHTTPLVSRAGKTVGMISTHWVTRHSPSERDFRLLDILARQAADLVERTQADEALRASETQLKEADRRKDEFLATLAHELRNPLAPLRTSLELIRLAANTPESVEEVRIMMEEQLGLLVHLVDDLLDVSRITSGKIRLQRRPTELATLVATAVQANRSALDAAQVSLSIDVPDTPVLLDIDPTRFVQVVSNVLHNAVKFTDPGGRISIAANLTEPDHTHPREVMLRITDSGVGISREMLPRVFELFSQDNAMAHRSNAGLGIGLALARRLIEMHGGSIDAHSDGPGLGSIFTLRMPVSREVTAAQAAPPPLEALRISTRVVVIDDNHSAAHAMQRLVTALGGECQVAHDGEAGLAAVREFRPDIVILDIGMPRIDGYETCRRIREEFGSSLVVVAVTGWGQERDKEKALRAGFDVHLTKPADPIVLEGLLAAAGRRDGTDSSVLAQ